MDHQACIQFMYKASTQSPQSTIGPSPYLQLVVSESHEIIVVPLVPTWLDQLCQVSINKMTELHVLQDYPYNKHTSLPTYKSHVQRDIIISPKVHLHKSIQTLAESWTNSGKRVKLEQQNCLALSVFDIIDPKPQHNLFRWLTSVHCYVQVHKHLLLPSISFIPFLMSFLYWLLMRCQAYVNLSPSVSLFSAILCRYTFS